MRAKDLEQIIVSPRALEFGYSKLKLGFILNLPYKLEEGFQRGELLEASDQLFDVPLSIDKASTIILVNNLLILVRFIICTEDAPGMFNEFGVSFLHAIVAFHH